MTTGAVDESQSFVALPHAEWNLEERGESTTQRLDRNYVELLQELRVTQTAVCLLFAFLLGLAFTPRFATLNSWQRGTYVVVLVCAAASAMIVMVPVLHHRLVFRRRLKQRVVQVSHTCALVGIALMTLSLLGTLAIATSMVIGPWAALLSGCLAVLFAILSCGLPLRDRPREPSSVHVSRSARESDALELLDLPPGRG